MNIKIPIPSARQREFFLDTHRYVAFGGARGGGKSWAVRVKALLLAAAHPGIKILILRRTYPELYTNHILPLEEMLYGFAEYNEQKKHFRLPNNSMIRFGFCAAERDVLQYQGQEYDIIFIDEATQLTEYQFICLTACNRGVNDFPKRVYLTCNPGGIGHAWVKRLFIDRRFNENEDPSAYSFIRSKVIDNPALLAADPDYLQKLKALPSKLRRAWLDGDWNVFEGQFFEEFITQTTSDNRFTHVIPPFIPPQSWKIYRSFDFGYAKPFSVGWYAVDHDGVAYRILELYGCTRDPNTGVRWTPDKIFSEIATLEKEHPYLSGRNISGVADPSIWDASRGESIFEAALRNEIYFVRGSNSRIPGWMQIRRRLAFDSDGFPTLYIFESCEACIRTLPTLQFDSQHPEDLDSNGEDHIADELRYFCMQRPLSL